MLSACEQPKDETPLNTEKYHIRVCNGVGCDSYYADSVLRNGDTYQLFKGAVKTVEIKSQIVVIELNK